MDELQKLTLETVGMGSLNTHVDELINQASRDVQERPNVKKPRRISIEIAITPIEQEGKNGLVNMPWIEASAKLSMPGVKCISSQGMVQDGVIMVSVMSDDIRQPILPGVLEFSNNKAQ